MLPAELSKIIKSYSTDFGFSYCGISKAEKLEEEARMLEKWLNENRHGKMSYMENYFDKRVDPRLLVPGAKSVVSLMYNYFTADQQNENSEYKISKYAYGEDYHTVIKNKLSELIETLNSKIGDFHARIFVDSAPVMEKAWAKKSGIGWLGKNTNIINPKSGSFFFLAEIICDLELEPDGPIKDYCGSCTACVDACPTDALHDPYFIDSTKCISYLTIELRDENIGDEFKNKMENWIYGCDICQDVCPWNRFSKQHNENAFIPSEDLMEMNKQDWEDITEDVFRTLFKNSAIKRTKFSGLKRNIKFISGT